MARSQKSIPKKITKNLFRDSILSNHWKEPGLDELPVIGFEETEKTEHAVSVIPSMLFANRDVFMSMSGKH